MIWTRRPYSEHGTALGHRSIYETSEEAHLETQRERAKEERTHPSAAKGLDASRLPPPLAPGTPLIGLRVDVDTHDGMRDGVPRLLDVLGAAGVKGTFYLAFGPDKSGRAILNVLKRPGFLRKMLRTGAPKVYGMRTMLSGTLLPPRPVALAFPDLARRIEAEGHETGVHAWDHRTWQDRLQAFPSERVVGELERGAEAYQEVFGRPPRTYAAPAWYCCNESLLHQEVMDLVFASDCRGMDPFFPVVEAKKLQTVQVPSNLPTLDEALGETDRTAEAFFSRMLEEARNWEWPVLTVHAELEGGPYAGSFATFLEGAKRRGVSVVPLGVLLATRVAVGTPLPACTMAYGAIEGRHGVVSLQMLEV